MTAVVRPRSLNGVNEVPITFALAHFLYHSTKMATMAQTGATDTKKTTQMVTEQPMMKVNKLLNANVDKRDAVKIRLNEAIYLYRDLGLQSQG